MGIIVRFCYNPSIMQKILLSGVKPTGRSHIGNYFGAMKQWLSLQDEYQCYLFIADYHSLNFIQNADEMNKNILDLALDYLAIGLDPNKVTMFKQSDVSEHTELAWIFDTITTMPYLERAHAFALVLDLGVDLCVPAQRYAGPQMVHRQQVIFPRAV